MAYTKTKDWKSAVYDAIDSLDKISTRLKKLKSDDLVFAICDKEADNIISVCDSVVAITNHLPDGMIYTVFNLITACDGINLRIYTHDDDYLLESQLIVSKTDYLANKLRSAVGMSQNHKCFSSTF